MSLQKYPTLNQDAQRVQQVREALHKGCFHLTYKKWVNAAQAAKSLGGVLVNHNGKWAVVL